MEILMFIALFAIIFALQLGAEKLDKKHGWQLANWLNGEANTPFKDQDQNQLNTSANKSSNEVAELKERIQVLEKIVTDQAFDLNQKIGKL